MEKKKRREEYIRTYVSPWERAMKGDEDLVATMKSSMPGPIRIHPEAPMYKSFNRYAGRLSRKPPEAPESPPDAGQADSPADLDFSTLCLWL